MAFTMMYPFLVSDIYASPSFSGKLPYILDMSDFFSDQAKRALEGDDEMAHHLFSDIASSTTCQQPHTTVLTTGYTLNVPAAAAAPGYYGHGYYHSNHPQYTEDGAYGAANTTSMMGYQPHHNGPVSGPAMGQGYATSESPVGYSSPMSQITSPIASTSPSSYHAHHRHHQRRQSSRALTHRSESPDAGDLADYGVRNPDGTWRCAHPGCSSKTVFTRACDLRKHYNRHKKYLFCRFEGCPQATDGGFSSKKDRARHEAKHNPQITCEWNGCDRVFSRVDNMKDHVRRIHHRGSR
ncbi:hypothetical protein BGW36DRAFT_374649 [Talaromyces proteolyticus]|uniref:C2H2-type domain-containing protein n=1 Tax=Talaromyces proteolyticus TaxID=1131652 RepID=A0AAD4KVB8_9EURO|nr:uncharacterized protein BGW36DRAFT_374649 [Talaromyces proteolyticus]KAH8700651.1 hypothetical protein BGW36DRAFT_374649 [Talaromyces proteolyticus]